MTDKEKIDKLTEGFQEDVKRILMGIIDHNALGVSLNIGPGVDIFIGLENFPGYIANGEFVDDTEEPEEEPRIQLVH